MTKGKFIVFEGGEGTGKDTKIELLKKEQPEWVYTKEPGGTKFGLEMRRLLLEWRDGEIDPLAELFFFSAARVHFMKEVVRPALEQGKTVVTNRFALSTIAYQVYGRERPDLLPIAREAIKASVGLPAQAGDTMPDFTILFDLDPAEGIRRVEQRDDGKTRFDAESLAFHQRVREGYLKHAADFGPHTIIDASGSIEEVWAKTKKALEGRGV